MFNQPFFPPLLDPDVPLRPMGMLLLVTGLNAARAELSGLATDVLIAAINDGRLDGDNLGETLAEVARINVKAPKDAPGRNRSAIAPPVPFVKLNRWAKGLERRSEDFAAPRASSRKPFHACCAASPSTPGRQQAATSCCVLLEGTPDRDRRGPLFSDPEADYLNQDKTSAKKGSLIHELLTLKAVPDHPTRRAGRGSGIGLQGRTRGAVGGLEP